ncbi:MAG: hypothetical protein ACW986_14335, partial [Promethearchaeota archaeon]
VFGIMDVDGDGIKDYFVDKASVASDWVAPTSNTSIHHSPRIFPNLNTNQIISGSNGTDIEIPTGDGINFTNYYVHDLMFLSDTSDSIEDLILLESIGQEKVEPPPENITYIDYKASITTYFINGTMKSNISSVFQGTFDSNIPAFEPFQYNGQSQLLFIHPTSLILFNLSSSNFLDTIYNVTLPRSFDEYEIIEDLNLDGISEILATSKDGTFALINGIDGGIIRELIIPTDYSSVLIDEINSASGDGVALFLMRTGLWHAGGLQEIIWQVFSLDLTSQEILWDAMREGYNIETDVYVLNEDLDGDSIDELIFRARHYPLIGFGEVWRYRIFSVISGKNFAIMNTEFHGRSIITINDFDSDNKKDFVITGDERVFGLSSRKPLGIWLSSEFQLGLPLFIVLALLLGIGLIIVLLRGKRLNYRRRSVKEHKLTVAVNIIAVTLMTLTFLLFLLFLNVFNNTLIAGTNNTNIVIAFITVTIVWYGTLPLTAALYNRFAPQFAFIFVKLRNLFFKISKSYKNDILVLDMEDRNDIGLVIQLKRLILPLLLSISVGFYTYDTLITILKYPRTFEVFGSTEFFSFMMGYMFFCVLPMILSFVLFSFFISGNNLLDDAGVVYYREHKKYRTPGDIEPISIWAQSIIKGIAGLSALLTFGTFLLNVDFSGFFGEGNAANFIFGIFIVIVMFGGIPFLTGCSYLLLAGEVMEADIEKNTQKLYNIMKNNGYDPTPRKITNIYPSEYPKNSDPPHSEHSETKI